MKTFSKLILHKDTVTQDTVRMEMELQKAAAEMVPCPAVLEFHSDPGRSILVMERIEGDTIYDLYGDDATKVPSLVWNQIYRIVKTLFENGIYYIDITPFNFMVQDSKVYIIDFGHASRIKGTTKNWFLKEFLDGEVAWNPDFA